MIILSEPTSLPPAFQPLPAADALPPFPWAAFAGLQLYRDAASSQAGPSTSTPPQRGRSSRFREKTKDAVFTPVHPGYTFSDQESEINQSDIDIDPDYNPSDQHPLSPPNPRNRSRSRSRASGTPIPEKRYPCEEPGCGKTFSRPAKLKEHLLGHSGERPFKCPHLQCLASYARLSHLQRHALTHKNPSEKAFVCVWKGVDGKEGASCGKRFWTKEKLGRHERGHLVENEGKGEGKGGKGKKFDCPHCSQTFHKHTRLRSHVLDTHRDALLAESREGTPKRVFKKRLTPFSSVKPGDDEQGDESEDDHEMEREAEQDDEDAKGRIRAEDEPRYRPFRCEVRGCGWTFETAQRLKMHGKVHQGKRYICSHPDHADDLPSFSRWSDLQSHIKADHPPVCPYEACQGRVFKNRDNLKEHVKLHVDRGDLLHPISSAASPGRATRASSEPSTAVRGRKRRRDADYDPEEEREDGRGKRLKRTESDVGKEWMCNEEGCDKSFKTKRALTVHHSTAHLGLRPFACPHAECGNTYGHKHLLQRHIAARHREPSDGPDPMVDLPKFLAKPEPSGGSILTGMHALQKMANKVLACPCASVELGNESGRCQQRFGRVYDVKRHVRKVHGLELSESEARLMLGDAEDGDITTAA